MTSENGVHRAGVPIQIPATNLSGVAGSGLGSTCETTRAGLTAWMQALSDRLRRVRICCGDFARVLGPSVTTKHGLTSVFLDPPYGHDEREAELYTTEDAGAASRAAEWARANGDDPLLRICLAGYEGEHVMPESWECVRWKAAGGYGSQGEGRGRENSARECLWFSKSCLPEVQVQRPLDLFPAPSPTGGEV